AKVDGEAPRDVPIILGEGGERCCHQVLAILVAQTAAGGPTEHELGQAIAGGAAVLRIGGEFAVERKLAARKAGGVAEHVAVLEFAACLEPVLSRRMEQDVVELRD